MDTQVIDLSMMNTERKETLFEYWFIRYNPLYFFSAMCVLIGVFLMSRGFDEMGLKNGSFMITGIVESYQFLLISGAALLYRSARQRRPAVILGMLELAFLYDSTFQIETLGTLGGHGIAMLSLWVVLLWCKLMYMKWAFRLKVSMSAILIPVLAGAGMAFTPAVLDAAMFHRNIVHLLMFWYGIGMIALFRVANTRIASDDDLNEWGLTVLRRASSTFYYTLMGFYAFHMAASAVQFSISINASYAASVLVFMAIASKSEKTVWWYAVGAIAVGLVFPSMAFSPTALLLAVVLAAQANYLEKERLYVGAVLAFHAALWTMGWSGWPLGIPPLALSAGTVLVLLLMSWMLRSKFAAFSAAVVSLGIICLYKPESIMEWGIIVTLVGFIVLVIGVAINWNLRSVNR